MNRSMFGKATWQELHHRPTHADDFTVAKAPSAIEMIGLRCLYPMHEAMAKYADGLQPKDVFFLYRADPYQDERILVWCEPIGEWVLPYRYVVGYESDVLTRLEGGEPLESIMFSGKDQLFKWGGMYYWDEASRSVIPSVTSRFRPDGYTLDDSSHSVCLAMSFGRKMGNLYTFAQAQDFSSRRAAPTRDRQNDFTV